MSYVPCLEDLIVHEKEEACKSRTMIEYCGGQVILSIEGIEDMSEKIMIYLGLET